MKIRILLAATLLAAGQAYAADPATLSRADSLREKPFADAKVVAPLAAGTKIDVVTRNHSLLGCHHTANRRAIFVAAN